MNWRPAAAVRDLGTPVAVVIVPRIFYGFARVSLGIIRRTEACYGVAGVRFRRAR